MIKKIVVAILLILTFLMLSITVQAADETITLTDDINDVVRILEDGEISVTKPNFDIEEITAIKTGDEVELRLKLIDGGIIEKSTFSGTVLILNGYTIELQTSHHVYTASYLGLDIDEETLEALEGLGGVADPFDLKCFVQVDYTDYLEDISYTGEGENLLSITFDLYNDYEKLIGLLGVVEALGEEFSYMDEAFINDTIKVDSGGHYSGKAGEKINYKGTLEEGDPSDYEWLWVIDDSSKMFEGAETSYNKLIKTGNYTGTLFVYDSMGSYGYDTFTVNITGSSSVNGANGGDTDSGIMLFIIIIAVVIIAGVAVVIFFIRR